MSMFIVYISFFWGHTKRKYPYYWINVFVIDPAVLSHLHYLIHIYKVTTHTVRSIHVKGPLKMRKESNADSSHFPSINQLSFIVIMILN